MAGLERRLDQVAHEASVWRSGAQMDRMRRIEDFFEDDESATEGPLLRALPRRRRRRADPVDLGIEGLDGVNATTLRRALAALDDELVLYFVADEVAEAAGDAPEDQAWAAASSRRWSGGVVPGRGHRPLPGRAARRGAGRDHSSPSSTSSRPRRPTPTTRRRSSTAWPGTPPTGATPKRAARLWQRLAGTPMVDDDPSTSPLPHRGHVRGRSAPGAQRPALVRLGAQYKQCYQGELPMPTLAGRCRGWVAKAAAVRHLAP